VTHAPLAARVARELDELGLARGPWLVAVSGGPDSTALLLLLSAEAGARGLTLHVSHADHGIHPDSAAVAERVRGLAERLHLPVVVGRLALGADAGETEAREARYAWLRAECERHGAHGILTAHHADDQAETVLMRVLRGSGPAGLAGMSRRAADVVRPLLPFRREELAQYLLERGESAWIDPANLDPRHLRTWIRTSLLPRIHERLPDVTDRLIAVAAQARLDGEAWDDVLEGWPGLDARIAPGQVSLAADVLAGLGTPLALRLLRAAGRRAGRVMPLAAARRAIGLARGGSSGQRVDLGLCWNAELAFGRLVLAAAAGAPADTALPASGTLHWGAWRLTLRLEPAGRAERVAWHAWLAPGELVVGAPEQGERLRPLGGTGSRSVARLLQEAKVPRGERMAWPVLRRGGRPVWVPGVSRSETDVPEPGQEAVRIDVERA
jgi:tRNA(Ile)-lysidine synthase